MEEPRIKQRPYNSVSNLKKNDNLINFIHSSLFTNSFNVLAVYDIELNEFVS